MIDETALPDPGEVPVLDWLDVDLIGVEPMYQRPLDMNRVESIVRGFSWRSFGALVVVPQAGGRFNVTDGQHRLEAAKLHPKVTHVPAVIVKADDVHAEAGIFVEINKNRKNVNALELFFAQLTAGDDDAQTIQNVCQRAGVRIPKYSSAGFKAGDTVAIAAVQAVISRRGAMLARQYLEILAKAQFAPITANQIKAVDLLMTSDEFASSITLEDLGETVKAAGTAADADAKRFSATHGVPVWQGLANVWFQRTKKKRTPSTPAKPTASPAVIRTITPHRLTSEPVVTGAVMGDPAPGRSALDQRRNAS